MGSEKRLGRPGSAEKKNPDLNEKTGYNYGKTYSASGCGHRLYRTIQHFRSGSDTSPEPGEGSGYRNRIPIAISGKKEDASPHACRSAQKSAQRTKGYAHTGGGCSYADSKAIKGRIM